MILRSDGTPTYNLAVVSDDLEVRRYEPRLAIETEIEAETDRSYEPVPPTEAQPGAQGQEEDRAPLHAQTQARHRADNSFRGQISGRQAAQVPLAVPDHDQSLILPGSETVTV